MNFKQFEYNNIEWEYAFLDSSLLIYASWNYSWVYHIDIEEDCLGNLTTEELAGLLSIEYNIY